MAFQRVDRWTLGIGSTQRQRPQRNTGDSLNVAGDHVGATFPPTAAGVYWEDSHTWAVKPAKSLSELMSSQPDLHSQVQCPLCLISPPPLSMRAPFTDSWMWNESNETNKSRNKAENKHQLRPTERTKELRRDILQVDAPVGPSVQVQPPPQGACEKALCPRPKALEQTSVQNQSASLSGNCVFLRVSGNQRMQRPGLQQNWPILSSIGGQGQSQAHASIWKVPSNAPMEEEVDQWLADPPRCFHFSEQLAVGGAGVFPRSSTWQHNTTQQVY